MPRLAVIVPMHNEQEMAELFLARVLPAAKQCTNDFEFIFVNDGSTDDSLARIKAAANEHPFVKIVSRARNFGKEAAVTAGLKNLSGDAVIIMEADYRTRPKLSPSFGKNFSKGLKTSTAYGRNANGL